MLSYLCFKYISLRFLQGGWSRKVVSSRMFRTAMAGNRCTTRPRVETAPRSSTCCISTRRTWTLLHRAAGPRYGSWRATAGRIWRATSCAPDVSCGTRWRCARYGRPTVTSVCRCRCSTRKRSAPILSRMRRAGLVLCHSPSSRRNVTSRSCRVCLRIVIRNVRRLPQKPSKTMARKRQGKTRNPLATVGVIGPT